MKNINNLISNNNFEELYKLLINDDKINDYILDGNNLLHILAIRGNNFLFDILDNNKIDKYYSNIRGDNILHLLIKNGWDDLSIKLVKLDNTFLDYLNYQRQYPIFYSLERIELFNILFKEVIDNFKDQINTIDVSNRTLVSYIIDYIDNKQDNKYFKIIKDNYKVIDFDVDINRPLLIQAILNKKIELSLFLINKSLGINTSNKSQLFPLHAIIEIENLKLLKNILANKKFDKEILNYGGLRNENLPLNMCFKKLLITKKKNNIIKLIKLLTDNISNFNIIDQNKNLYAHYLVNLIYNKKIKINKEIADKILSFSNLDFKNIIGYTPNNIIKNKKENDICLVSTDNKIIFPDVDKKQSSGLFIPDILHSMMYMLYLLNKYDNLTIPTDYSKDIVSNRKKIGNKLLMQNIPYNQIYIGMRDIILFGCDVYYLMMIFLVLWYDKDNYWIHDKFDEGLKKAINDDNKRFILIKITIFTKSFTLHSNIVLFDKETNSYRRFEPYGNLIINDENDIDMVILKYLQKHITKKIKFYKPSDYLELGRFQSVSNDGSAEVRKQGDPQGYCLAWCVWYIDIRLTNPNLSEQDLIKMAAEKIFTSYCDSKNPYNDFIRDYGLMLTDEKNKLFTKFKIDKNNFYDVYYKLPTLDLISIGITKELEKLI